MTIAFPYPPDPAANLRWRVRCRERALRDLRFRDALYQACLLDPLFFFSFALWVYEPRATIKVRPFLPWPHQAPVILAMDETITQAMASQQPTSLVLKKSRAQGGTYIYLGVQIRRAIAESGFSSGLVSRNENMTDSRTDATAVMFKLAWMLDRLPFWLLEGYERNLSDHTISLPNQSLWVGYAATSDVARGGRLTMFAFDEPGSEEFIAGGKDYKILSSVSHVTYCVFLCSTFGVDSGVFYEAATDPDRKNYTLDWKDNPEHARLAYVMREGVGVAVRPEEQKDVTEYVASHQRELRAIDRRGHQLEGKVRSPWYDAHCLQPGATTRYIARELDMDPRGAVGKVFPTTLLDRVKRESCKPPVWQGTPVFDSENLVLKGLLPREDGPLKLWFRPGVDNSCPLGPFTVGCDMAVGSDGAYSSNSVASGVDDRTGEQILEYVVKGMPLIKFARITVGICLWLRNALLGWEDSGMAAPFAKEIMEVIYYGNVFFRDVPEIGSKRRSRKAGWSNQRNEDKADLFEKLALGMEMGKYTARSEEMIRECGEYEWDKGKIIHAPTKNRGATEKNHGDRCLIEGTLVVTEFGEKPIERVVPGDMVWTRNGLRPVVVSGETGAEPVFRLILSNGRSLTGTGNHPVWTENRSWVPLQSLRECDRLLAWEYPNLEDCPCQQNQSEAECTSATRPRRRLSSTAGCTTATPTRSRSTGAGTSGAGENTAMGKRSPFTSPFGSIITGLSQRAITCITRMATFSTTTLRTLNASRIPNMGRSTRTEGICKNIGTPTDTRTFAGIANESTERFGNTARSFAARRARTNTGTTTGLVTKPACASSADRHTERISTDLPRRVPQSAAQLCVQKIERLDRPAKVYNLSVAETPEYFAEGVLVHNCIAAGVAYLVYSAKTDGNSIDRGESEGDIVPEYGSFLWCERRERSRIDPDSPEWGLKDVVTY